jgi:hypothetical protein
MNLSSLLKQKFYWRSMFTELLQNRRQYLYNHNVCLFYNRLFLSAASIPSVWQLNSDYRTLLKIKYSESKNAHCYVLTKRNLFKWMYILWRVLTFLTGLSFCSFLKTSPRCSLFYYFSLKYLNHANFLIQGVLH